MGSKIVKFLAFTIVMSTVFLCVFVTPSMMESNSVLVLDSSYKLIPYVETNDLASLTDSTISNYDAIETFIGTVTAYGPDCVGCSGITASGFKVIDLNNKDASDAVITYEDEEFGVVRIFAAAAAKFPFGTIIRISGDRIDGYVTGIVLDRGGAMANAYAEGEILLDLLFATENSDEVYIFGRQHNVKIEVLRYGR